MNASLVYLSSADVGTCLPTVSRQLDLVQRVFIEKAEGRVEQPPKPCLTCGPGDYHLALPAGLRALRQVGIKWVSTYESNAALGLPYVHGLVVLSDWETGAPTAIVEGRSLTGFRTAAVTGVILRLLAGGRGSRVTFVGTGEQARYHLPVLAQVVDGLELVVFDAVLERAEAFAATARVQAGVAGVVVAGTLEEAVRDARIVITSGVVHDSRPSPIVPSILADDCLLVAIDWDVMVPAATACAAPLFIVDDHLEYEFYRSDYERKEEETSFDAWPLHAHLDLGEALMAGGEGSPPGAGELTLVAPLGIGAADVVLASAVLERAQRDMCGVKLSA